jgi:hypothetical protein
VTLVLKPLPYAQLVLRGTQKARLVASVLVALDDEVSKLVGAASVDNLHRRGREEPCPVVRRKLSVCASHRR